MAPPDAARRKELGRLLDQQRRDLRYSRAGLARLAGVSYDTVRSAITGANWPQDTTATGLEAALKLRPGWIADYGAGATDELELADDRPRIVRENWNRPLVPAIWNTAAESEGGPSRDARIAAITLYVNQFLPAELARRAG